MKTRLKMCAAAFVINSALFLTGMIMEVDLTALGAGLSMLNVPVISYVVGETKRSSGTKDGIKN
tara:strand:+ start:5600 stop:5791 length:192 start_codon:yes stop_codon:yes gene_type:complete